MRDGVTDCEDVVALIDEITRLGSELDDVETKAAQGGLPARIYRSLSALSNRRGGGVILFGVDEETLAWLNQLASYPLSDRQRFALAYRRVNVEMTNADYQMSEEDKRLNRQFYGM